MSGIESNCSESISDRDELTATERRKNDGATEQQIHNSNEDRNIGKRPFEEVQNPESSFKRQRCKAFADKEQHEWEFPDELASYANKYLQKFVQDKNLKGSILNENPVPTNITKPRKLDKYYTELLEENRAKRELTLDGTLKIQSKTLNIMGPLSKLWFRFEEALAQENNMVRLDLNELIQYLEQSVMLVGQAFNAFNVITYTRRLNVLSAVQDKQKAKNIIKDQAELSEKPSLDLFGRVFRDHVKETAKFKKECKEIYCRERPDQNKRPFSKGPSFSKQDMGDSQLLQKSLITNGKVVAVKGIKTEASLVRKYNKKATFFNKNIPQLKKTQQGRNLYQGNCSSTIFRWKFTRNSSITPVKGCTPIGAKLTSKCKSQQFSAAIFCKTLEKIDKDPRNFRMSVWSKNRLHLGAISGKSSTSSKNVSTVILASDKGGGIYVEEGSHPKNICEKRSILEQPVFSRKKGWGEQTCDKLKKSERIHSLSSVQYGRLAFAEGHVERESLYVQDRPKGCLLLCSLASKTSEVHSILLGRSIIAIPLSMFWSGTSSPNFYKATENPSSDSTMNRHSDHRLPRRYPLNEPKNRRPEHGKGHNDFSLTATGVHNKSEKISTVGNTETRIFGPGNRLSQHDSSFGNGKSKKFNTEMQKLDGKFQTNVVGNYKLDRFTLLNSTGSDASIFTNKISATTASGIYKKGIFLPLNSSSEPKLNSGTNMVRKQPRNMKWEVNFVNHKQNYNPNRCFSEELGCILSETINRRSMDSSGVKVTHQSARTQSYKFGPINFSQDVLSESSPFSSGQ